MGIEPAKEDSWRLHEKECLVDDQAGNQETEKEMKLTRLLLGVLGVTLVAVGVLTPVWVTAIMQSVPPVYQEPCLVSGTLTGIISAVVGMFCFAGSIMP